MARPVPSRLLLKPEDSTMSPIFPFDVIEVIIDMVGENKDTDPLKELALVLPWSLIPSTRSVSNIYLPTSIFMTLSRFRITTSHLQRRDSSSLLKADQILPTISANSHIE